MQMTPELVIPSMSTSLKGLILEKFSSLISLALCEDFTLLL